MLRKLFISLIILTALTSDASALSAYMRSAGLSPEGLLNHMEEGRLLSESTGKLYISTADDIIKSHTMQCRLDFVLSDGIGSEGGLPSYRRIEHKTVKAVSEDITFSSGTSPPAC